MYREGTFFYHAHTGSIRAEGAYGMIVIKNTLQTQIYDEEMSLILSDWYHKGVGELTTGEPESNLA